MNVFDKNLLFEMSYALMRRFAFIELHPDDEPVKSLLRRWLTACNKEMVRAELLDARLQLVHELEPADVVVTRIGERRAIGDVDPVAVQGGRVVVGDGLDADERAVAHGAAVQHRLMADRHVLADLHRGLYHHGVGRLRPREVVREFENTIVDELDLVHEADPQCLLRVDRAAGEQQVACDLVVAVDADFEAEEPVNLAHPLA